MDLNRQSRVEQHKKQDRMQVKSGSPSVSDLKEGVPVLRLTHEGVVEYVKIAGTLHRNVFATPTDAPKFLPAAIADVIDDLDGASLTGNTVTTASSPSLGELEACVGVLGGKINAILAVLRSQNVIET